MPRLSPFWSAAVSLSGRLNLVDLPTATLGHTHPTPAELRAAGVPPRFIDKLQAGSAPIDARRFVVFTDPDYPPVLRVLPYAPPVLFLEGNAELLKHVGVAIVGARRCTGLGRTMARSFSMGVTGAGGVVVSGMAHGIDTAAHEAAAGQTIAVLGQGLNAGLGRLRTALARRILQEGGLLMSEFRPTAHPAKYTYPLRNRVIAGLSSVTVIVESAARSGTRITARHALDAGRDVLVVPGHPLQPSMAGNLSLLAEGAGLAVNVQDVLDAAGLSRQVPDRDRHPLLEMIGAGITFRELSARCEVATPALLRQLAELELAGLVRCVDGHYYVPDTRYKAATGSINDV